MTNSTAETVFAGQPIPDTITCSIFLAGPTPRSLDHQSWRPEAIRLLRDSGFEGTIFCPEAADGAPRPDYTEQAEWEQACMEASDCILFWIPRIVDGMPAFTTNDEWGFWKASGKVVLGAPPEAEKIRYQQWWAERLNVPAATSLSDTVAEAMKVAQSTSIRTGPERRVPAYLWNTESFQRWLGDLRSSGNRLDGIDVLWTHRVGHNNSVFAWAIKPNIWVAKEQRHKSGEVVLSRPDTVATVLYQRGGTLNDSTVALVREFRSPAARHLVLECPGGAPGNPQELNAAGAAEEVFEETGLEIAPSRLQPLGEVHGRQPLATFSAHRTSAFAVELTAAEMDYLRAQETAGDPLGLAEASERTWVRVVTVAELRRSEADWATLGMVLDALA